MFHGTEEITWENSSGVKGSVCNVFKAKKKRVHRRRGCIETRVYAPPYASVAAATSDDVCPRPLLRLELLITDHGFFVFAKCHKQRRRQLVLIITNAKQSHPASTVLLIGSASFDLFRFVRRRDDIR